jgi:antitoxin component YwqK of YwqJK toxin-antitoxin module
MKRKNVSISLRIFPLMFFISVSCNDKQSKDGSLIIPFDPKNVVTVNKTDENGKKQGLWRELDTVNHRISKEFYFKDNLLDGSYLEYKTASPDTLILGYYKFGNKHGEWKYWDTISNELNRIEIFKNNILIETKKR